MMLQSTASDVYSSHRPAQHRPPGKSAVVRAGVVSFFKSLHPGCVSGSAQVEYPAFCVDSSDQQSASPLQRTELATRVICACAGLSPEVVSFVGYLANISAAARWIHSKCTELVTGKNSHEEHSAAGKRQPKKQYRGASCRRPAQLPKAVVALGTVSCLGAVGAKTQWIEVNDASVLSKIGHDPAYPLDGHYRQVADIDAWNLISPIGNESHPFIGEYDGRCKTIRNLDHCFVKKLDGNGRLYNQIFFGARIVSNERAGVVACQVSGKAALGHITVQESSVITWKDNAPAGFAAAVAGNKTVIDSFKLVGPATVETRQKESPAGLVVGEAHGIVNNTRSVYGVVKTLKSGSQAGSVAGTTDGVINNTVNILARVITRGDQAYAGGGAGHALAGAVIDKTVLVLCKLTTTGYRSCLGGGAGAVEKGATVTDTLLIETNLATVGIAADAAAGGGFVNGNVTMTTMVEGVVSTRGIGAQAAVGGGEVYLSGRVSKTTGRDVTIKTAGDSGDAGVGAGEVFGVVNQTSCFNSAISTKSPNAYAGVGGGDVFGSVDKVVSISCNVTTSGGESDAGFGAGKGTAQRVTAVYSKVEATGRKAIADVNGGTDFFVCSSSVVGDREVPPIFPCCVHDYDSSCLVIPGELCRYADQRVLTAKCVPLPPPYFDSGRGGGFICPARSTAGTLNVTDAPAASVNWTPPATPPVLSGSTSALNMGVVMSITLGLLGGAALLGVCGNAIYRHYRNRDRSQQKATSEDVHEL